MLLTVFDADKPSKPSVRIPAAVVKGDTVTLECVTVSFGNKRYNLLLSYLMFRYIKLCSIALCHPALLHVNSLKSKCFMSAPFWRKVILGTKSTFVQFFCNCDGSAGVWILWESKFALSIENETRRFHRLA